MYSVFFGSCSLHSCVRLSPSFIEDLWMAMSRHFSSRWGCRLWHIHHFHARYNDLNYSVWNIICSIIVFWFSSSLTNFILVRIMNMLYQTFNHNRNSLLYQDWMLCPKLFQTSKVQPTCSHQACTGSTLYLSIVACVFVRCFVWYD